MRRRAFLGALGAGVLAGCNAPAGDGATTGSDDGTTTTTDRTATGDVTTTGTGTGTATSTDGTGTTTTTASDAFRVETVATDLRIPWGVVFRDDALYVTERPGRVARVAGGQVRRVADLTESTAHAGEGGLMGLALGPDGDRAYAAQTYRASGGLRNRVLELDPADGFARRRVLLDGIPGASIHDGGRVAVRDGALYVTTGDATQRSTVQDPEALNGKVLRLTLGGDPHPDNPFGNEVFTLGHRNPQGLAWHPDTGDLWSSEHGPASDDEINVLRAGGNYGWPEVMGRSDGDRFADPLKTWTPTIAPASAAFYGGPVGPWRGDLFVPALADTDLRRLEVDADAPAVAGEETLLDGEYGRLRTAVSGPDGHLYVTTSNRDGRGSPAPPDDRVLRLVPA